MEARIVINGASFPQPITGVQRYARELSDRLLQHADVVLVVPEVADLHNEAWAGEVRVVPPGRISSRLGMHSWVNRELRLNREPDAVLWSPTIRAPIRAGNHVPTVHDLSPLEHPEWFHPAVVMQHRIVVGSCARTADIVITDSQFSKQRLESLLGVPEAKIRVIPCGVSPRFSHVTAVERERVVNKYALPDRFVLSVATLEPRKNLRRLLDAWGNLPRSTRDSLPLLLAGGVGRHFANPGTTSGLPAGVRLLGYIQDEDLPALYASASIFAYPSVYEGFGLPPLEAMAAGAPVLALEACQAVVELAAGSALLVGNSAQALTEGLEHLAGDQTAAATLVLAGRRRALEYSWDRSALTLRRVLLEAETSVS